MVIFEIVMLILLGLLVSALPAHAQGRGHGGERRGNERQQPRQQQERQHNDHVRDNRGAYGHGDHDNHYRDRARDYREPRHDGRGYIEHERWERYYGREHHFYWGHCRWHGRRYWQNSRFYYGSYWFMIVDVVPDYWGDDEVFIEYDDAGYWLYNPVYPGVRISIVVIP